MGRLAASFYPQHEDGQQPTIDESAGMNREWWDELVFDATERGYPAEQTIVAVGRGPGPASLRE